MSCLVEVARVDSLLRAWSEISRRKLGRPAAYREGSDGHSLESFSRRSDAEISQLSLRLRNGSFSFSRLDPHFVVKASGKTRVICAPIIADRIVQRSILNALSSRQGWMFNSVSYGFVSERGVVLAAQEACKRRRQDPWVFKTDITKFFDCVDRPLLREKVKRQIRQRSLHQLVLSAIDCEIRDGSKAEQAKIRAAGIRFGAGVRQGMPLSPFFANLFLARFDQACEQKGISVVRYADDLIFFGSSQQHVMELSAFCKAELRKLHLEIPGLEEAGKSQIYSPQQSAEFLGVELAPVGNGDYQVRVGQNQLQQIKSAMYELSDLKELRKKGLDVARFGNALLAKGAAYAAVYEFCANSSDIESRLRDWSAAVKHKVAVKLGINPSELSADGRWFLGISA